MSAEPSVSPADTRTENNVQRGLREAALAKLRRSTELACGYPDATITRAEACQLLDERDALLAVGERDRRRIAQLTEVGKAAQLVADLNAEGRISYGRFVSQAEFHAALFALELAVTRDVRAVLAGEEDGP